MLHDKVRPLSFASPRCSRTVIACFFRASHLASGAPRLRAGARTALFSHGFCFLSRFFVVVETDREEEKRCFDLCVLLFLTSLKTTPSAAAAALQADLRISTSFRFPFPYFVPVSESRPPSETSAAMGILDRYEAKDKERNSKERASDSRRLTLPIVFLFSLSLFLSQPSATS